MITNIRGASYCETSQSGHIRTSAEGFDVSKWADIGLRTVITPQARHSFVRVKGQAYATMFFSRGNPPESFHTCLRKQYHGLRTIIL